MENQGSDQGPGPGRGGKAPRKRSGFMSLFSPTRTQVSYADETRPHADTCTSDQRLYSACQAAILTVHQAASFSIMFVPACIFFLCSISRCSIHMCAVCEGTAPCSKRHRRSSFSTSGTGRARCGAHSLLALRNFLQGHYMALNLGVRLLILSRLPTFPPFAGGPSTSTAARTVVTFADQQV